VDALTLHDVQSGYGRLIILRDVSLALAHGRTLGIVGSNGAGKTTLLKTIAGLLPCRGEISLFGCPIQSMPAYSRTRLGLGLVPEGRQIFGEMTVAENLQLALNARAAAAPTEIARLFDEVYDLFPILAERKNQGGGSLSGGQQQMLAIGRAFMAGPKVLMLDEPTQGLAPKLVGELMEILQRFKSRFSMLIVEQNKAFVDNLADAVLRMEDGTLHNGDVSPAMHNDDEASVTCAG
jgi:ABC-type branched-subunit amino acid transport system ATPase component